MTFHKSAARDSYPADCAAGRSGVRVLCALSKGRHVSFMVSLVAAPASQTAPSTCGKCVVPNMTSSGLLCVSIVPRFPLHGLCCVLLSVQTTTPTRSRMRVTFGDGVDVRVPMHSPASVWHVTCSVFVTCEFQHLKIVTESVVSISTSCYMWRASIRNGHGA